MWFEIWLTISVALFFVATIQFVRALRKRKNSFWENIRKWIVNIIDILSGG